MSENQRLLNVPNVLSAYRLLAFPIICYSMYILNDRMFILLLSINLITDILDGLIARAFKLQTDFGAKLDSLADIGTYICAFTGMFVFHYDFMIENKWAFIALIIFYVVPQIISLIKFKKNASLHLYSNKITGYFQGIWIFTFFNFGNYQPYFIFMVCFAILAYTEELLCILLLKEMKSNVKTYFHLKKSLNA